jgi:hypothetical protein
VYCDLILSHDYEEFAMKFKWKMESSSVAPSLKTKGGSSITLPCLENFVSFIWQTHYVEVAFCYLVTVTQFSVPKKTEPWESCDMLTCSWHWKVEVFDVQEILKCGDWFRERFWKMTNIENYKSLKMMLFWIFSFLLILKYYTEKCILKIYVKVIIVYIPLE